MRREKSRVRSSELRSRCLQAALISVVIAVPAFAQRAPLFKSEILPILEKNCVGCHGPQNKMASLDLSSFAAMMQGSSSGPVSLPHSAAWLRRPKANPPAEHTIRELADA